MAANPGTADAASAARGIAPLVRVVATTQVGSMPYGLAVNSVTDTVYVANSDENAGSVSVVSATSCSAQDLGGCRTVWPAVAAGASPAAVAVDSVTDTVYVVDASANTVSVINGATCRAGVTRGCAHAVATVAVGISPSAIAVDPLTDTVYVANAGANTVSVINGASCNGTRTSGCAVRPRTVAVGDAPGGIAVDPSTDTVYVANTADDTLSVIDGAACNPRTGSRCATRSSTVAVGVSPQAVAVDVATDTVYVANLSSDTVSVVSGEHCNGSISSSCSTATPNVPVGAEPSSLAVDEASDTVYVADSGSETIAVIDGSDCSSADYSGCATVAATVKLGNSPYGVAIDTATSPHSVYVSNDTDDTVSVLASSAEPGYGVATTGGGAFTFGQAPFDGSLPSRGIRPPAPIVGVAADPDGGGYWMVTSDGNVYNFGHAPFEGSEAGHHLNAPIVGIAADPDGAGYWLVASDGGVFSFGSSAFHGSTGAMRLNRPIVGIAAGPDGVGYWLVASDGGVFSFGDAAFHGSTGAIRLNKPIVGMAAGPDGAGYWLVASDGGVFSFGDARFEGSLGGEHLSAPVVGMVTDPGGAGYWLFGADGKVSSFGGAPYLGSAPDLATSPQGTVAGAASGL